MVCSVLHTTLFFLLFYYCFPKKLICIFSSTRNPLRNVCITAAWWSKSSIKLNREIKRICIFFLEDNLIRSQGLLYANSRCFNFAKCSNSLITKKFFGIFSMWCSIYFHHFIFWYIYFFFIFIPIQKDVYVLDWFVPFWVQRKNVFWNLHLLYSLRIYINFLFCFWNYLYTITYWVLCYSSQNFLLIFFSSTLHCCLSKDLFYFIFYRKCIAFYCNLRMQKNK